MQNVHWQSRRRARLSEKHTFWTPVASSEADGLGLGLFRLLQIKNRVCFAIFGERIVKKNWFFLIYSDTQIFGDRPSAMMMDMASQTWSAKLGPRVSETRQTFVCGIQRSAFPPRRKPQDKRALGIKKRGLQCLFYTVAIHSSFKIEVTWHFWKNACLGPVWGSEDCEIISDIIIGGFRKFSAKGAGSAVCYCLSRFRVPQNLQCRSLHNMYQVGRPLVPKVL